MRNARAVKLLAGALRVYGGDLKTNHWDERLEVVSESSTQENLRKRKSALMQCHPKNSHQNGSYTEASSHLLEADGLIQARASYHHDLLFQPFQV